MKKLLFIALLTALFPALSSAKAPGFLEKRMGELSGQILVEGKTPLNGGIASFFNAEDGPPPLMPSGARVPDAVAKVDSEGYFNARLVPGKYYLGALLVTEPGRGPGPPQPGEKFYFAVDEKKAPRIFSLTFKEVKDAGRITALPPTSIADTSMYLTLKGRIVGPDGKPFPKAVALAKKDPRAMRPDFVSQPAGKDGEFEMMIPEGMYYLMAREMVGDSIMGQPQPGSYVGTYGVEQSPSEGVPGSSGPAGGISPPARSGRQPFMGPATGISAGAAVDTEDAEPVGGKAGEVIKDLTITMFEIARPSKPKAEHYFNVIGTVRDSSGKPLSGMQVHAKESFTEFRPPFTSEVTDDAGTFKLRLPAGTEYYLLARQAAMGPPKPGSLVGYYGLQEPIKELLVFLNPDSPEREKYFQQAKSVNGKKDETVDGIVITVFPYGTETEEGMISLPAK